MVYGICNYCIPLPWMVWGGSERFFFARVTASSCASSSQRSPPVGLVLSTSVGLPRLCSSSLGKAAQFGWHLHQSHHREKHRNNEVIRLKDPEENTRNPMSRQSCLGTSGWLLFTHPFNFQVIPFLSTPFNPQVQELLTKQGCEELWSIEDPQSLL